MRTDSSCCAVCQGAARCRSFLSGTEWSHGRNDLFCHRRNAFRSGTSRSGQTADTSLVVSNEKLRPARCASENGALKADSVPASGPFDHAGVVCGFLILDDVYYRQRVLQDNAHYQTMRTTRQCAL